MEQLVIHVSEEGIGKFISLLQSGIAVETSTEDSILDTVQKLEGFTEEYIDDEVQTIFLDGTAIDNIFAPIDQNNKVLALSAAMPGLSGAIYKRNSIHAALRSVQQSSAAQTGARIPVTVTIKLFNAIARDRGPELLKRGVKMQTASVMGFFSSREWISNYISDISLGNQKISLDGLAAVLEPRHQVNVQVTSS